MLIEFFLTRLTTKQHHDDEVVAMTSEEMYMLLINAWALDKGVEIENVQIEKTEKT